MKYKYISAVSAKELRSLAARLEDILRKSFSQMSMPLGNEKGFWYSNLIWDEYVTTLRECKDIQESSRKKNQKMQLNDISMLTKFCEAVIESFRLGDIWQASRDANMFEYGSRMLSPNRLLAMATRNEKRCKELLLNGNLTNDAERQMLKNDTNDDRDELRDIEMNGTPIPVCAMNLLCISMVTRSVPSSFSAKNIKALLKQLKLVFSQLFCVSKSTLDTVTKAKIMHTESCRSLASEVLSFVNDIKLSVKMVIDIDKEISELVLATSCLVEVATLTQKKTTCSVLSVLAETLVNTVMLYSVHNVMTLSSLREINCVRTKLINDFWKTSVSCKDWLIFLNEQLKLYRVVDTTNSAETTSEERLTLYSSSMFPEKSPLCFVKISKTPLKENNIDSRCFYPCEAVKDKSNSWETKVVTETVRECAMNNYEKRSKKIRSQSKERHVFKNLTSSYGLPFQVTDDQTITSTDKVLTTRLSLITSSCAEESTPPNPLVDSSLPLHHTESSVIETASGCGDTASIRIIAPVLIDIIDIDINSIDSVLKDTVHFAENNCIVPVMNDIIHRDIKGVASVWKDKMRVDINNVSPVLKDTTHVNSVTSKLKDTIDIDTNNVAPVLKNTIQLDINSVAPVFKETIHTDIDSIAPVFNDKIHLDVRSIDTSQSDISDYLDIASVNNTTSAIVNRYINNEKETPTTGYTWCKQTKKKVTANCKQKETANYNQKVMVDSKQKVNVNAMQEFTVNSVAVIKKVIPNNDLKKFTDVSKGIKTDISNCVRKDSNNISHPARSGVLRSSVCDMFNTVQKAISGIFKPKKAVSDLVRIASKHVIIDDIQDQNSMPENLKSVSEDLRYFSKSLSEVVSDTLLLQTHVRDCSSNGMLEDPNSVSEDPNSVSDDVSNNLAVDVTDFSYIFSENVSNTRMLDSDDSYFLDSLSGDVSNTLLLQTYVGDCSNSVSEDPNSASEDSNCVSEVPNSVSENVSNLFDDDGNFSYILSDDVRNDLMLDNDDRYFSHSLSEDVFHTLPLHTDVRYFSDSLSEDVSNTFLLQTHVRDCPNSMSENPNSGSEVQNSVFESLNSVSKDSNSVSVDVNNMLIPQSVVRAFHDSVSDHISNTFDIQTDVSGCPVNVSVNVSNECPSENVRDFPDSMSTNVRTEFKMQSDITNFPYIVFEDISNTPKKVITPKTCSKSFDNALKIRNHISDILTMTANEANDVIKLHKIVGEFLNVASKDDGFGSSLLSNSMVGEGLDSLSKDISDAVMYQEMFRKCVESASKIATSGYIWCKQKVAENSKQKVIINCKPKVMIQGRSKIKKNNKQKADVNTMQKGTVNFRNNNVSSLKIVSPEQDLKVFADASRDSNNDISIRFKKSLNNITTVANMQMSNDITTVDNLLNPNNATTITTVANFRKTEISKSSHYPSKNVTHFIAQRKENTSHFSVPRQATGSQTLIQNQTYRSESIDSAVRNSCSGLIKFSAPKKAKAITINSKYVTRKKNVHISNEIVEYRKKWLKSFNKIFFNEVPVINFKMKTRSEKKIPILNTVEMRSEKKLPIMNTMGNSVTSSTKTHNTTATQSDTTAHTTVIQSDTTAQTTVTQSKSMLVEVSDNSMAIAFTDNRKSTMVAIMTPFSEVFKKPEVLPSTESTLKDITAKEASDGATVNFTDRKANLPCAAVSLGARSKDTPNAAAVSGAGSKETSNIDKRSVISDEFYHFDQFSTEGVRGKRGPIYRGPPSSKMTKRKYLSTDQDEDNSLKRVTESKTRGSKKEQVKNTESHQRSAVLLAETDSALASAKEIASSIGTKKYSYDRKSRAARTRYENQMYLASLKVIERRTKNE